MRRSLVLGLLIAAGVVAGVYSQQPAGAGQPAAPKEIKVEKLKDNLYALMGGGGNTGVFIGSSGVIVVDAKNPGWGQPILDEIKKITPKPITTLINTHTHGDHVSGNVEFPANVEVIVQDNTKTNMEKMKIFAANNGKGLPKRTFTDRLTLGSGADQIDLYYFGRGHTNGDAWIVFPSLRFMHSGDIFSAKAIPLLDANNGGSGVAIPDSLAKAHATIKNVDSIITGHGPVMTMNDLAEFAEFNRDFLRAAQEAKKAGKTVDEAAAGWTMPAKYQGYGKADPMRVRGNMQVIYDELK